MKIRFIIQCILFLSLTEFAFSQYTSSSFYVVAHPDDWQLFMGKDVWDDIEMNSRKVVIILLTAGDACNGTGYCSYRIPYFTSRENGTKNSVYLVADNSSSPPSGLGRPVNEAVSVNNHIIIKWQYKNVVLYFLRLPDGRPHFSDHAHFTCGFDQQDSTYINLFRRGILHKLSDITGESTYQEWSDLRNTVGTIVSNEKTGPTVWIHTSDFSPAFNVGTHPDHRETGLLVENISKNLPGFNVAYYVDYATNGMAINLSDIDIMKETGLFAAYNVGKINDGCPTDWNTNDLQWCERNYISRYFNSSLSSRDSSQKTGFIVEVFPNPSDQATTVSMVISSTESVTCSLYDIQGKMVETLTDNQLLTPGKYNFFIHKLPQGIYFLKLLTKSGYTLEEKILFN